jgi:ATP-binding cassette subfamily B protein
MAPASDSLRDSPASRPGGKKTSAGGAVLRLLLAAVMRYRTRTVLALTLVVAAKLSAVAVPLALKAIVDELGPGGGAALQLPAALLLGYAVLRFFGTFFSEIRDLLFARVTQDTVTGFLLEAFTHLHRLGVRFHAMRRTGGVTRDVERGTQGIGFLLGVALFTVLPTVVEIVAVVVIIGLGYGAWFILVILGTFLAYTIFTVTYTERRAVYQRALNKLDSKANARLVDSLLNYETVKYYANERFEHERFGGILGRSVEVAVQNQKALSTLHIGQSGIIAVGVASIMMLAGQNVVAGQMTVGDLVLVNAYVIQVCLPLNSLGFVFRQARDAIVNAEQLFALMRERPEVEETPGLPDLRVERGEVRFEHVSFAYEPNRQILSDVSFAIPPGATVAVVGGSGSGKSTLVRLLFRFYEAQEGAISIDGQDVRGVSQRSLRGAVGIVPQDTILFNDTIAYNIGYGRADADFDDIVNAAKAAHVHEFISMLPDGYETLVGERGVKLSGGEKQRIAIARAILKNPPILVLDEATSALDTRSERAIQDELERLARTRTTLVIAHRLSTVVNAGEILVLEHGRVVERGRHDELLALGGAYAQMWRLQRQQQALEQAEQKLV